MKKFKLGHWYAAKQDIRGSFREYRKGILRRDEKIAIIFAYRGARRVHYGDKLNYLKGEILYVGEGKRGNQRLTASNKALVNAMSSKTTVNVFLNCGDVFKPKKILFAGEWNVVRCRYASLREDRSRRVYQFTLRPG